MAVENRESVAIAVHEAGCVKFGKFILKSGLESPIYIDLRRLRSYPAQKQEVVGAYADLLAPLTFDLLADVPTAATPLVASLSDRLMVPQITPRMADKLHGSGAQIDGEFSAGQIAVVVDDLITTSLSKKEAIDVLEEKGKLRVTDVAVLIDRMQGGREQLAALGYNLHTYFTMPELLDFYRAASMISTEQFDTTMAFLGLK